MSTKPKPSATSTSRVIIDLAIFACSASVLLVGFGYFWHSVSPSSLPVDSDGLSASYLDVSPAGSQDLGTINQHSTVEAVFNVTNKSDYVVRILDAVTSCSCTVTDLTATSLEPGESLPVNVQMQSRNSRGDVRASVLVGYRRDDNCNVKTVTLHLKAHVEPDVKVTPTSLVFTTQRREKQRVTVEPKKIASIRIDNPNVNATCFEVHAVNSEDSAFLDITFIPEKYEEGVGMEDATLTFNTNYEKEKLIAIPVKVRESKN